MTVGELKKALEEFDDNLKVYHMDNFEDYVTPNPTLVDNDTSSDEPYVEL